MDHSFVNKVRDKLDNLKRNEGQQQLESIRNLNAWRVNSTTRDQFLNFCLVDVIETIISCHRPGWPNVSHKHQNEFDFIFLDESHPENWLILNRFFKTTEASYKLDKVIVLLEKFIRGNRLAFLLIECSKHCDKALQTDVIAAISSFPDRAANKLKRNIRELFMPRNFFEKVSCGILAALQEIHSSIQSNHNASTLFLSELIGKLGITGRHDDVLVYLVNDLTKLMISDFIWRRITQQLFKNIPDRCLEPILISLVKHVPWFENMDHFLGNLILDSCQLQYLVTKKFFLFMQFEETTVIQNLVGYLSKNESRHTILIQTFKSVLEVWGDRSALRHRSYSHSYYLTRVIFVFVAFIKSYSINISKDIKRELMKIMMHGTQSYIESPQENLRSTGMMTSKHLAVILDPNGPQLEFDVPETSDCTNLHSLLEVPSQPSMVVDVASIHKKIGEMTLEASNSDNFDETDNKLQDSDLDSDDDLEPYEIPKETHKDRASKPKYIRDCMSGLVETDKPEWTEKCLQCMEDIIRAKPDNVDEVAEEVAKILLHLDDNFSIQRFSILRRNCMVAITSVSPAKAAAYLTSQFYDRNYNIRQRLDILETLALAAQELSNSGLKNTSRTIVTPKIQPHVGPSDWQQVIDERVRKKTRIISKGKTRPEGIPAKNEFFEVAGFFYFPLINYVDKKNVALDLFGEDSFVLGRLIYTLGIIINSAANSTLIKEMAPPMLDLIWTLRYHTEKYVRQALMFCFSMVLLSVPSQILVMEYKVEIFEFRYWLTDIIEHDPDIECQNLSKQALALLIETAKKECPENMT